MGSKIYRRSNIQRSLKLHGTGDKDLPANHAQKLIEIRAVADTYQLRDIYNVDESGLFYRMGPSRSYLDGSEDRATVRGTTMQKTKLRFQWYLSVMQMEAICCQ